MRKMKKLINCVFPDTVCNLDCEYCYVGQTNQHVRVSSKNEHSLEEIREALSYDRLGGCCHMNMCASGETLLVENIIELAKMFILEGHVVSLVTNGTVTEKIREICSLPEEIRNYLFLKVSFHYLELKRKGKSDIFWDNVRCLKNAKVSFTVEMTVNDETVPFADDVKQECMDNIGAVCHVIESRKQDGHNWPRLTGMAIEEHQKVWGQFQSSLFDFQQTIWGEKRTEFCYAGDWICSIDIKSGAVAQCFGGGQVLDNIYADTSREINFCAVGRKCPWGHCYAAYVLLTHGAIPEFTQLTYAEERNRKGTDGKDWLQPSISQTFSEKLESANNRYTEERKALTDFIMGVVYEGDSEVQNTLVEAMVEWIEENAFHNIVIYGAGKLGLAIYNLLGQCGIKAACFMDRRYQCLQLPVACVSDSHCMEKADVIIVTVYREFSQIQKNLRKNGNSCRILNITQLFH